MKRFYTCIQDDCACRWLRLPGYRYLRISLPLWNRKVCWGRLLHMQPLGTPKKHSTWVRDEEVPWSWLFGWSKVTHYGVWVTQLGEFFKDAEKPCPRRRSTD